MKRSVVITGGRDYWDRDAFDATMALVNPDMIYVGDAMGADRMAVEWAKLNHKDHLRFEADWSNGGHGGPIRNTKMLMQAKQDGVKVLLAFPGADGTNDCVKKAKDMGFTVIRVQR